MALVSMPGTVAERFPFTVRSDAIARQINDSIGAKVAVTYEQHIGIPTTCFGETGLLRDRRQGRAGPAAASAGTVLSVSCAASGSPVCRATCRSRSR